MAGTSLLIFVLLFIFASGIELNLPDPPLPQDANHIFNAIHSSIRQFGSSLRHNGMSFFLASVPADVQFYHGNGYAEPVTGMEWLAFEPEHAMMFAHIWRGGGPPKRPPPDQEVLQHEMPLLHEHYLATMFEEKKPPRRPQPQPGWLHTYRTKHPLRLAYLDGMSAGKTTNGTLDFEDYVVLLGNRSHPDMWEVERAQKLCKIAKDDWGGKIDGFLRMEAGFEIILCDFEKHLNTVHVKRVGTSNITFQDDAASSFFDYWRAIQDRFFDIGGERIKLYYHFVTAYGRSLPLFLEDQPMPRLENVSQEELALMRTEIDELVAKSPEIFDKADEWVDWRGIADLIVTRYASRLKFLTSSAFANNTGKLHGELDRTLSPFIDYDERDIFTEIRRCTTHFLPEVDEPSLTSDAVTFVSYSTCARLFSALQFSAPDAPDWLPDPFDVLKELIEYLDWTTWKQCGMCKDDELCVIPVWPYGSLEDHEHPSCHNATAAFSQRGYWGGRPFR